MTHSLDEIFIVNEERVESLPIRPLRSGLFGKNLDDALQSLLQKYPQLIPGKQMDPVSDDPPRFALLRHEMPVNGWSLDHLYIDQKGILTLVETKLIQNPELRRQVIGQIIEYAASASEFWAEGRARQYATEFWSTQGREVDNIILEQLGDDIDTEALWETMEANLKKGKIRLIIAMEEFSSEVLRMIEYLSYEMRNTELLGLELKCYGYDSASIVMVPRLVGHTHDSVDYKKTGGESTLWSVEKLREAYHTLPDESRGQKLVGVLEYALKKDMFLAVKTMAPVMALKGNNALRRVSFFHNGTVAVFINEKYFARGREERDEFVGKLQEMALLDTEFDIEKIVEGKNLSRTIDDLNDTELRELLELFWRYS